MKKILSILMVVMVVACTPLSAFASTTESMLMYAVVNDEYSVMPLAAVSNSFDFSLFTGAYQRFDDTYALNEVDMGVRTSGSYVSDLDWYGVTYNTNYAAGLMPMFAFSIGEASSSSSFSIPDNSTLNIYINDFYADLWNDNKQSFFVLSSNNAVPYRVFADMYFTAMQVVNNTHSGTYHNQTVELTNFAVPASVPYDSNWAFDVNLSIPIIAEKNIGEGIDRIYNINLRYIKVYVVYDFSQYLKNDYSNLPLRLNTGDFLSYKWGFRNLGDSQLTSRISLTYLAGSSDSTFNSGISGLQSSVSALNTNVTNQISQVKTQITQSTNTITTKIDTMENDVKTGLQNVVTSAQQNTQNIINTVTQKVDEVKTGITEVKDAVVDLPNKLEEKAIGLIVPEEEVIADKFDDFSGTLEQELGILYEVPEMVFDLGETITSNIAEPQKQMTFPAFSLAMPDGETYQIWGEIVFDIMPAGMEILQDFCMTITGLIMVTATVNAIKEQYELFIRDQKG